MKAGLEVHQQLATGKLFCACPADLSETVTRTVDPTAARHRRREPRDRRGRRVPSVRATSPTSTRRPRRAASSSSTRSRPHALDPAALDVALTMALLLDARPLDEVEVMRKIVVDGSNTSGFQRTALVAVDGHARRGRPVVHDSDDLPRGGRGTEGRRIEGRDPATDSTGSGFRSSRSPPAPRSVQRGRSPRSSPRNSGSSSAPTGRVRRGIGTIREDVNVSAEGGARVELKGVQELRKIHQYVDGEVGRQATLLAAREKLTAAKARVPDDPPADRSDVAPPRVGDRSACATPCARGASCSGSVSPVFGGPPLAPRDLPRAAGTRARRPGTSGRAPGTAPFG